mmetsp:Transcript_15137/g.40689  ORF Transcript_15137/g.40689 Transcript_15137/m.40689 type:complete len:264 (-) Transcript_15137:82-873(-)
MEHPARASRVGRAVGVCEVFTGGEQQGLGLREHVDVAHAADEILARVEEEGGVGAHLAHAELRARGVVDGRVDDGVLAVGESRHVYRPDDLLVHVGDVRVGERRSDEPLGARLAREAVGVDERAPRLQVQRALVRQHVRMHHVHRLLLDRRQVRAALLAARRLAVGRLHVRLTHQPLLARQPPRARPVRELAPRAQLQRGVWHQHRRRHILHLDHLEPRDERAGPFEEPLVAGATDDDVAVLEGVLEVLARAQVQRLVRRHHL